MEAHWDLEGSLLRTDKDSISGLGVTVVGAVTLILMLMLSIGVKTELLEGERKPLLTLQEAVPEQAASSSGWSFLAFPSFLDHITGAGEADVHAFRGGAAVDVGNEHGREAGRALLGDRLRIAVSGAAVDDYGGTVHVHLMVADTVEPGPGQCVFMTVQVESLEGSRSVVNLTWH